MKVKDRYYFFVKDDSDYGTDMYMYIYNANDFTNITRHKVPADMVSIGCPIAYDETTDKVYSVYKDGTTYKTLHPRTNQTRTQRGGRIGQQTFSQ